MKRRVNPQSIRQSVLLVVEGAKTEISYFQSASRLIGLPIEIVHAGNRTDALSIVREAVSRKKKNKQEARRGEAAVYDQVWAVFDREKEDQQHNFNDAVQLAKSNDIHIAVSNPCFELWILLHFKYLEAAIPDCPTLIRTYLRKCLPNYCKSVDCTYKFIEDYKEAIMRSEKLWSFHQGSENSCPNPSTRVCDLMKTLEKIAAP